MLVQVFCIAYPLRRDGTKLPREQVQDGARRGWLTFTRMPAGQPVWTARLTAPSGASALPDLECAAVRHIERGIMVQGLVRLRGGSVHVRQAWWCVPDPDPPTGPPPDTVPPPGRRGAGSRKIEACATATAPRA